MIKASIVGATGYVGVELVRLLAQHPEVELVYLSSKSYEGQDIAALYPSLAGTIHKELVALDEAKFAAESDVVFTSLPHGASGEVIPRLRRHFGDHATILHRTLLVYRNTESGLSERLQDFERQLPDCIKLAYLPTPGMVRLRLTARGNDEALLAPLVDTQTEKLHEILGNDIFADGDLTIAGALGMQLWQHQYTLATAESCTGGNIAHEITDVAGSSRYFTGSVVAYSNEIKQQVLHVPAEVLQQHGAVSQPTVELMARGVQQLMGTTCAIATSGIAGPDGGTPEKPVGTVWIAARCGDTTITERCQFSGSRHYVIERATQRALLMLIELINR